MVTQTTMRWQATDTSVELFRSFPNVAILLSEIGVERFRPAFEFDPARILNVGIMEQSLIGVAAGFAMEGFHPIVHTIAPFLAERPYEQLKLDFGYQGLGGTFFSVGASNDYSTDGATHHAPGDVAALLAIPTFHVLAPGHPAEVDRLLRQTYDNGLPTYLRTTFAENREAHDVHASRLEIVRRGHAGTVIAFGPMLDRVLEATRELDVDILYATSVRPFDRATLHEVAGATPAVITVEPWYEGSVAELLAETFSDRPARIGSIGIPKRFAFRYGAPQEHDAENGLDAEGIARRLRAFFGSA
jgi:transketolase